MLVGTVDLKAYRREYYKANKDKLNKRNRAYYAENRQSLLAYAKEYTAENREMLRIKYRDWALLNKDKLGEIHSRWRSINPDKIAARNARRRAIAREATPSWANNFIMEEIYALSRLRTQVTGIDWHVDHIVPLKSNIVCGLNCEINLRVITGVENMSKSNRYWPDMP